MSLDAPLSDKAILAKAAERGARVVGSATAAPVTTRAAMLTVQPSDAIDGPACGLPVRLGPDSPLHQVQSRHRARHDDREFPIQCEIVAWADDPATLPAYPELKTLYAVPNQSGAGGQRTKRQRQLEGARRTAEGRRKGMPDLVLPTPRRDRECRVYGALYLEIKDEQGTTSKAQRERIAMLRAAGNKCEVAMSADAAKAIITMYLQLPKP